MKTFEKSSLTKILLQKFQGKTQHGEKKKGEKRKGRVVGRFTECADQSH